MADLHVLRRSDSELLHVARSDDAVKCAAALSSDQAFDVQVAALLPGLGPWLPAVQQRLRAPVKGCWYAAPLPAVLGAMAASMEQAAGPAAPAGPEGGDDVMEICEGVCSEAGLAGPRRVTKAAPVVEGEGADADPLQEYLEVCSIAEADKAADVTRALGERLGKEAAKQLLRSARQVALAGADGKKRRVFKAGRVRGQALRLRQ
jgi:hypothetical protein